MACKENAVSTVNVHELASAIRSKVDQVLIVDSRSFLEYNDFHIVGAVNVCCSKLVKRRLQQDKVTLKDFLLNSCHIQVVENSDVIVYDQSSLSTTCIAKDSFLHVLLQKLFQVFRKVFLLSGGFLEFQACYRDLCEDKSRRCPTLTSLSQPCLPISNVGPTRILPFLYLGSQQDANNKELLMDHNISYEVNVSTNCPKPDFIQDSHFLRLPVNDSYGEKLLPYFVKATQFIDKVREANGCVLVHCLAGISRSPTVAIAYVMRHLKLTFDDAFRYVKSKRATISPNFNFLGQLLEYERQLRAEEVLDSSVGDISTAPVTRCALGLVGGSNKGKVSQSGRECLSRSMSLSLSLSLKSPLETVPSSPEQSSIDEDSSSTIHQTTDLSPTSALARLTFDGMEIDQQSEEVKESDRSIYVVSQRKHTESYRSLRLREQHLTESHYYSNKQTTESRSHMILTVSKRVSQSVPFLPRSRWKELPVEENSSSHCSEISVRIEGAKPTEDDDIEVRRKGTFLQRPHSDGFRNRIRQGYNPIDISSFNDDFILPSTPCTPPHSLHCPQNWSYARSDSVTTSGLGSEVSDTDTRADDSLSLCGSVRFGCPSEETDSLPPDDGVFTETAMSTRCASPQPSPPPGLRSRPRPSSLLGITPAREIDWKPNIIEGGNGRKPRPTSLSNLVSPLASLRTRKEDLTNNESLDLNEPLVLPSDEHPDSASVFRMWRQREAKLEQDRTECLAPLVSRHRSKEVTTRSSEKRKSSEIPEESESSSAMEKRRTTRGEGNRNSIMEDGLYRVKSCPGIVDQVEVDPSLPSSIHLELQLSESRQETLVRLRVRSQSRVSPLQRYSCGALDQTTPLDVKPPSPCGSRHNSNPSLTHNGFSVIQVS